MREEHHGRREMSGPSRQKKLRKRLLTGATVISAIIVLLWLAWTLLQPPELPTGPTVTPGSPSASASGSDSESWEVEGPSIAQSGRKPGVYTFLVAGLDVASGATDTMLLLSFDTNEKVIQGLNLPRDTIMNVTYNSKRLNTIYTINKGRDPATQVEKGMTALKTHVSKLTGILPDYYVLLEWEAIGELVDALGGVEFNVPFDMDYDDPYQDLHIHQKAGLRKLTGDDAMQVIRHRKNNDGSHSAGDVGRLAIQQDFLKAVAKTCLQPATFLKIPALAEIFVDNVKTDLTIGNILAFAKMAVGMDPSSGVSFRTAPLAADAWYKGAAMVTLDGAGIAAIVNDGMNPYLRDVEESDLELIYKKADGSYGVTNGTLADSAMGAVKKPEPVPEPPKEPEVPVEDPEVPTEPGVPEDPNAPTEPGVPEDPNAPEGTDVPAEPNGEPETPSDPDTQTEQPPVEQPGGEEIPADPGVELPAEPQPEVPDQTQEIPEWEIPVIP